MAHWAHHSASSSTALAAAILVPLDGDGPTAIIAAGRSLESFEPRLQVSADRDEVLHLHVNADEAPFAMCEAAVHRAIAQGQWPLLLPGRMAATWGAIRALWKRYPTLSVVSCSARAQFGSDTDLDGGESWLEPVYRHKIAAVHIGLRNCSESAWQWLQAHPTSIFAVQDVRDAATVAAALPTGPTFLAVDCDVLDPGLVAEVLQPEPGGLSWMQLTETCREIFALCPVVGIALGGLNPGLHGTLSARVAARLLNWLLACRVLHATNLPVSPPQASAPRLD